MQKIFIIAALIFLYYNAFSKDATFQIMGNHYIVDTDKIDRIEYVPIGGVMINYDDVEYFIFQMLEETGITILDKTDSKYMFNAMHKLIHPTSGQPEIFNKLRMAFEINPDASNVDILYIKEYTIAFIIRGQLSEAYFCNHALCNIIAYKGNDDSLLNDIKRAN